MSRPDLYTRDRDWHPPQYAPGYKSSVLRSPRRHLISLEGGEGELTGPVYGHASLDELDNDLLRNYATGGDPIGERIVVHGQVLDQNARPQPGVLPEVWQANAGGRYRHVLGNYAKDELDHLADMLGAIAAEAEWLARGDDARFMSDVALRLQD